MRRFSNPLRRSRLSSTVEVAEALTNDSMGKKALISCVTGQDGTYLAELRLSKG